MEIDDDWPIDSPKRGENEDHLLHLLQGMEFLAGGFTAFVKTGLPPQVGGLQYENPFHAQRVAKFHIFALRLLMDNWIESGREGAYEDVRKRHLSEPLMDTLMGWSSSRPPELSFRRWDGKPSLYLPVGRTHDPDHPFRNAWNTAIVLFARFLDSPYRYRIAKCRASGCTYYYSYRIPRGPLKYGTFCPVHRQSASAARSQNRKREAVNENRVKIARGLWGKWPTEARSEKSKRIWLTAELNRLQSKAYPPVKVNWITWHLDEIAEQKQ
jgi:hypothetical protein